MTAEWRLRDDLGRRYAAVSGDHNPIHLHAWAAKPFGFPRAIAHGMWTKARCLAALRLPDAFTAEVRFKQPILLPGKVTFGEAEDRFAVHGHLEGVLTRVAVLHRAARELLGRRQLELSGDRAGEQPDAGAEHDRHVGDDHVVELARLRELAGELTAADAPTARRHRPPRACRRCGRRPRPGRSGRRRPSGVSSSRCVKTHAGTPA